MHTTKRSMPKRLVPKLIGSVVALSLVLAACGDDDSTAADKSTASSADSSTPSSSSTDYGYGPGDDYSSTPEADPSADTPASDATVAVVNDPELGEILVGPDGRTLYLFEKDQGTTTACTGGCADNWPPLVAQGPLVAGDGVDAQELSTADGIEADQVTYHGHLLYYFAGDQAAGDTNGLNVPAWYPIDPTGEAVGER